MLLIIFLGLIAKITLVFCQCDIGKQDVKDFDFNKFAGPRTWYALLHESNSFEDQFDCPESIVPCPEGNVSLVTAHVYNISSQSHIIFHGNATNWTSTGSFTVSTSVSEFTGQMYIIAMDYKRYGIFKLCLPGSNEPSVFVAFRKKRPSKGTMKAVMKDLEENNIDGSQLVEWSMDHCLDLESSTNRRSCK